MRERSVVLFSKPSIAGRVKTRLVGNLSAADVAGLHAAFLADLRRELAPERFGLRMAWALEDGESMPPATPGRPGPAPDLALRQRGADLGARQWHALAEVASTARAVAAIGSDLPDLSAERVDAAFAALDSGFDAALGPAEDGGYYLLALRREAVCEKLFRDRTWSTAEVAEETLRRLHEAGRRVRVLPVERDVDTPDDLLALAERLAVAPQRCPSTRAWLAERRLLPLEVAT